MNQKSKKLIKITIKVLLDLSLLVAVFFAGNIFGDQVIGGCPSIESIKSCYSCIGTVVPNGVVLP